MVYHYVSLEVKVAAVAAMVRAVPVPLRVDDDWLLMFKGYTLSPPVRHLLDLCLWPPGFCLWLPGVCHCEFWLPFPLCLSVSLP